MRVGVCDCDCVCLFLCQVGSWAAPSPGSAKAYFLPATLPACGWCLCPLVNWWFSVSMAGSFCVCQLTPDGCFLEPGPPSSVGGSSALGSLWMSVAQIFYVSVSGSGGEGLWLLILAIAYSLWRNLI
ncbi:hypothetical protein CHARACLAT_031321 [Characodon lateralis]|uniref:NADH dehydrogenase subunit 6 n=1 Tax=Characodon lateralis TaxID=208331 RepID=A0ABU7DZ63_9TELE|nr:hypothetical protein [Characodon lateralis]